MSSSRLNHDLSPVAMTPPRPSSRRQNVHTAAADAISEHTSTLALATVAAEYRAHPELEKYGARGRARCVEDTEYHLEFLITALQAGSVSQFVEYCGWAKVLLAGRGIALSHLIDNLNYLKAALRRRLSKTHFAVAANYLQAGIDALPGLPSDLPGRIDPERAYANIANAYLEALLRFERERASEIVLKASSKGMSVKDIYRYVLTPVQHEIGRLWQEGKLTVVHEHYCTAATEIVISELFRQLVAAGPPRDRRLLAFCVEGERHCIGVKMFADLMSVEGWQVQYAGQDTPTGSAIRFIQEERPALVAISVTLPPHLRSLETLVKEIRRTPDGKSVKVLIGGGATNDEVCHRIGANAYAPSIGDAVEVAQRLLA